MANTYFQGYCDSLIQSPDFISFSRRVYDIVGRNAPSAMILERICYWHGTSAKTGKSRLMVESDGKLWLAKNYTDWEDECCVNASTARKALDRLEELGIIETKIGKFQGVNSVLIRVIPEQFEYLSNMVGVSVQNGHLVSVQNGHLHIQESKTKQESTAKDSATIQKTDVAHEYEEISLEAVETHETKHSQGAWFMVRGVSGQDLTPPIIQEDLPPALRYLRKKSKRPTQVKLMFALDPQSKAVYQYVDALTFYAYFAPIDGTPMRYSWDLAAKERRWDAIKNMWRGAKRSLNTLDVTTLHTLWQRNPSTYAPSKIITALDAMEQENILQAQAQHEQAQFVTVYTDAGAIQLHKEHDATTIEALRKEGIAIHEHAQGKAS